MACLCLPAAALALLSGRWASMSPDELAMVLDEDGLPAALRWLEPVSLRPVAADAAFTMLVVDILTPVVAALAGAGSGVSARVLWGNAAHYLEWLPCWLLSEGMVSATRAQTVLTMLDRPVFPGGQRNPVAGAIHYGGLPRLPDNRRRKVCCLRNRLDSADVAGCGSLCPSPLPRGARGPA